MSKPIILNKLNKIVHLVGFTELVYYDARSKKTHKHKLIICTCSVLCVVRTTHNTDTLFLHSVWLFCSLDYAFSNYDERKTNKMHWYSKDMVYFENAFRCSFFHHKCLTSSVSRYKLCITTFQFKCGSQIIPISKWPSSYYVKDRNSDVNQYVEFQLHEFIIIIISGSAAQRGLWPPRHTRFREHTQWRAIVGRTPLNEWSALCRNLYPTTHTTYKYQCPRLDSKPRSQ
jgi:hypothetical protein